ADDQSFGERAAVVRAGRADREQFVAAAREKHRVVAHMPAHHAAIGNVTERHAACEVRPFRLGLLSCHEVRNPRSLSPYEAAPRRRTGHEQTTNRFDLFRFQSESVRWSTDRGRVLPNLRELRRGREAVSEWAAPKSKGAACTAPFVACCLIERMRFR